MYLVIDKNSLRHLRDTGIVYNTDKDELYNNLKSKIDAIEEKIVYLQDDSPLIKVVEKKLAEGNSFKVELQGENVVNII